MQFVICSSCKLHFVNFNSCKLQCVATFSTNYCNLGDCNSELHFLNNLIEILLCNSNILNLAELQFIKLQFAIHARAIIGRKRGLAGIGTKLVGVKLLNTLQQVSKLTSTN